MGDSLLAFEDKISLRSSWAHCAGRLAPNSLQKSSCLSLPRADIIGTLIISGYNVEVFSIGAHLYFMALFLETTMEITIVKKHRNTNFGKTSEK